MKPTSQQTVKASSNTQTYPKAPQPNKSLKTHERHPKPKRSRNKKRKARAIGEKKKKNREKNSDGGEQISSNIFRATNIFP
jgi:hypothetical protein